jgi:alpha-beta hydrolase superfamily lysophospholipase
VIVVRYDKRGLGESAFTLPYDDSLSFDDYVDDAIGMARFLKQYYRVSKLFVIGHNEGSLVGMKVAQQPFVDGYISISGAAKRGDELILRQTKIPDKRLRARAKSIFDSLAAGYLVGDVGDQLDDMLGPHKQLFLRSWLKYTPTVEIKKISKPILLLQGTKDIMIDRKDGKRLKKANSAAALEYIDGMNFVLKDTPDGNTNIKDIYRNPDMPLSAGLVPAILAFINSVK